MNSKDIWNHIFSFCEKPLLLRQICKFFNQIILEHHIFEIKFKDSRLVNLANSVNKISHIKIVKYDQNLIKELAELIKNKKPKKLTCCEGEQIGNDILKQIPLNSFKSITLSSINTTFTSTIDFPKLKLHTTLFHLVHIIRSCKSIRHLVIEGFVGTTTGFFDEYKNLKEIPILEFKVSEIRTCEAILRYLPKIGTLLFHLKLTALEESFAPIFQNKVKKIVLHIRKDSDKSDIKFTIPSTPIETIVLIDERENGYTSVKVHTFIKEFIYCGKSYLLSSRKIISREYTKRGFIWTGLDESEATTGSFTFDNIQITEYEQNEKNIRTLLKV